MRVINPEPQTEIEPYTVAFKVDPEYDTLPTFAIKTVGRSTQFVKHEYLIRLIVRFDSSLTYVMFCVVQPDMSARCRFNRIGMAFENQKYVYFKFRWEKYTLEKYQP